MERPLRLAAPIALMTLLAACGSSAPPRTSAAVAPKAAPAPLPPQCNTVPANFVVGQFITPELMEKARAAANADFARAVRSDQVITQEFRAGRLNLHLDAQRRILRVSCG